MVDALLSPLPTLPPQPLSRANVEKVERSREEVKGEHISAKLNKHRRICSCTGGSVRLGEMMKSKRPFTQSGFLLQSFGKDKANIVTTQSR